MKKMAIPAGFRFRPTEEELINSYLRPKIMGQFLPCNIVEEKQLYGGGDPWDVLHDGNQWIVLETDKGKIVKKAIYVFTKLTKKAAAGKLRKNGGVGGKEQFVRAAGCGTWDGQTGPREIKNGNGEVIGFRKMLVFEIRDLNPNSATHNMGHYLMHEYSLPGGESDYVLCEIIHDWNKRSKRKRGVVEEAEEIVVNPKRLMTIGKERKDEENIMTSCSADVPVLVRDEGGSSSFSSGTEYSQVLPLRVEYPDTSTTDDELIPMMESQEQTSEWEWGDLIKLAELLESDHEAGPSCIYGESQVPLGVEYPNTSTSTSAGELTPVIEFQQQTHEWDLFNLDELLDSEFDPCTDLI